MTALDRASDGGQQNFVAKWFRQKLDGSALHGPDGHWHIAVARDEDDRHVSSIGGQAFLQIETIQIGEGHVEHPATRPRRARARQEFPGGRESLNLPSLESQQRLKRFTHRNVVVNYEHRWCQVWHRQQYPRSSRARL